MHWIAAIAFCAFSWGNPRCFLCGENTVRAKPLGIRMLHLTDKFRCLSKRCCWQTTDGDLSSKCGVLTRATFQTAHDPPITTTQRRGLLAY